MTAREAADSLASVRAAAVTTMVIAWVLTGLAVGAVEGGLRVYAGEAPLLVAQCAGLTGLVALVLGLVAAAGQRACVRWWPGLARLVVDRRAGYWVGSAVVSAIVLGHVVRALARRTWLFDAEAFAMSLIGGGAALGAAALACAAVVARAPVMRFAGWLGERTPIFDARLAALHYALLVVVPAWYFLGRFGWVEVELLEQPLAIALWYAALALSVPVVWLLLDRGPAWLGSARALTASLALVAGLLAVTLLTYPAPGKAQAIERGVGAVVGAKLVRALADVDRDGAANVLGERDCAPLNRYRGPSARDVPGNGVDENCDGRDARPRSKKAASAQRIYYGGLEPARIQAYNVVWLVVDAVRADHVSALGYGQPTTPSLERLADEAVVFERALAQSSRTFFSVPSMFTGLDPAGMTWYTDLKMQQPSDRHITLAQRLGNAGYHTAIVLPGGMHRDYLGLQRGFEERVSYFPETRWKHWRERAAPLAVARMIELVESWRSSDAPFLLATHFIDPHNPYSTHPEVLSKEARIMSAYDQEIAFADHYIGFFLDYLRSKPEVWERTIVIVTSDHGEEFKEHGRRFHGFNCHRETIEVPLFVRVPGIAARRVPSTVALIDIVPALIELLGLPRDDGLDGQSLLVPIFDQARAGERPFFCATSSKYSGKYHERAVRLGRFSLHQSVQNGRARLYDLEADPAEKRNLFANPPPEANLPGLLELLRASASGNLHEHY